MKNGYVAAGLAMCILAWPTLADAQSTYQSFWAQATADPGCKSTDHVDFTSVSCDRDKTFWYFTKPNHPAHPAVIKRVITRESDGSWTTHEDGHWFAGSTGPAFNAWFAQIKDLDRQMHEVPKSQIDH
jgi:hypothetical protein